MFGVGIFLPKMRGKSGIRGSRDAPAAGKDGYGSGFFPGIGEFGKLQVGFGMGKFLPEWENSLMEWGKSSQEREYSLQEWKGMEKAGKRDGKNDGHGMEKMMDMGWEKDGKMGWRRKEKGWKRMGEKGWKRGFGDFVRGFGDIERGFGDTVRGFGDPEGIWGHREGFWGH